MTEFERHVAEALATIGHDGGCASIAQTEDAYGPCDCTYAQRLAARVAAAIEAAAAAPYWEKDAPEEGALDALRGKP